MRQGGFQAVTLGLANAAATSDEQLLITFFNHFFWIFCVAREGCNAEAGLHYKFVFIHVRIENSGSLTKNFILRFGISGSCRLLWCSGFG